MYRANQPQISFYDLLPPFRGELNPANRWVRLAQAIDWDTFEQEYRAQFSAAGAVALPARVAYGSLIVRAAYHATDRETVELVRESPYLQYFLGLPVFTDDVPFSARSMEKFRVRIPESRVRAAVRLLHKLEKGL